MSRKYENISEPDRNALEALITKMTYDAYNKGVNFGLLKGDERTEERIIKLLEDAIEERRKESISLMGWKFGKDWTPSMSSGVIGGMTLCLALIKGENK